MQQVGHRCAGAVAQANVGLLEADPLVAAQHGLVMAAVAAADEAVAVADWRRQAVARLLAR